MDIGNREEIVKRIRQVTGMRDPDQEEPTPEEIAAEQAKQVEAQKQDAMFQAELQGKQADTALKNANAEKAQVGAMQIAALLAGQNVNTQKAAIETALAMLQVPMAVPVADTVLHESGFQGRTEQETIAQQQQAQEQQAMIEQAAQEEQAQQEQAQQQQMAEQQQPAQQGQGIPPMAQPQA
ncbi:hypothetical protein G3A39_44835, partial [Paraburkholderia aspalathi]|nr:hypothetical protein [Paraburkholderia aspalathi]